MQPVQQVDSEDKLKLQII